MLPGIDGTALCRRIREQSRVPIIMLTAKEQEILAAVIAAVTEDLGPSASRMQITSINKI